MQTISPHDKAIGQYYQELTQYRDMGVSHELATKTAFQTLLAKFAPSAGWVLIPEQSLANGKRPDGTLRDTFNLPRGYWEAKDTGDELQAEIKKKIAIGYPTLNTIFEDTHWAVLYQNGRTALEVDIHEPRNIAGLLTQFFTYAEPEIATFEAAVQEFKERIPELAQGLLGLIQKEHVENKAFRDAFAGFYSLCSTSLDPNISAKTIQEMLVQHLLTERLFRTVFNNPGFAHRNVIAAEIESVIDALTSQKFDRAEFSHSLDRFYVAIEHAAQGLEDWTEKQAFMNVVYERFFQGWSVSEADTHGIVYTPQEIVDFMCASVEEVLRKEFGTSLSEPGVQILDPATGTGSFIVNLLRRISGTSLDHKYRHDLFANEVMLLPYYIASLNVEHAYYERTGQYLPFDGICFADTLDLEGQQMVMFTERNTERVLAEKQAQIRVVIGNPPYNVGQVSENDNNRNRHYAIVDERIRNTYAKDSHATNKNKLSDAYVKFFRWATDRLQGRDGIVCMVTNNSFVNQIAFDGMRRHLLKDFTTIYHLDLHGNVRQNPKLSGTIHNVFGIQVGVGITIAVRSSATATHGFYYYRVPEDWRKEEKLTFLAEHGSTANIAWQRLEPDGRNTWLTEGLRPEYTDFLPTVSQEAHDGGESIFSVHSPGIQTNRDTWMYDFDRDCLTDKALRMTETYNAELSRWIRAGCPRDIDSFVISDETKIKWSSRLKECFARRMEAMFDASHIRSALYRPFTRELVYFDSIMTHRRGSMPAIFPTQTSEGENTAICVTDLGSEKPFMTLVTHSIADLHLVGAGAGTMCLPYYVYDGEGNGRHEGITDWALARFQSTYGSAVAKRDIFNYVYGMFHHPVYRLRYAANLRRESPRIPLLADRRDFDTCSQIGAALAQLHLTYEQAPEYSVVVKDNPSQPVDRKVSKMRLTSDKTALIYNDWLTIEGIPPEVFEYRLGNRSALDWVIDQYQVSTDARSGIKSDPNRRDDPEYIVRLVKQVVTVSVETVRLVRELAAKVSLDGLMTSEVASPDN